MDNLPRRSVRPSAYRTGTLHTDQASLWSIFLIYGWVLLLHLSFAGLLLFNDYILHSWFADVLPLWKDEGYFSFPWWVYVYLPLFIFLYGFIELSPFFRLLKARKELQDAKITFLPGMVSNLHVVNSLGLLALLLAVIMAILFEDGFATHMLILILWGSYMKIGAVIGPRL